MTIDRSRDGDNLTIALTGRLDTTTTPELENELRESLLETDNITLDFAGLDYLSSAGLRLLLQIHKKLAGKGSLKVVNVNETIQEIFDITGFTGILNIE